VTAPSLAALPVREVAGEAWLARIGAPRVRAWVATGRVDPRRFPAHAWRDPVDARAAHYVIAQGDAPLAAIRLALYATQDHHPEAAALRALHAQLPAPLAAPERLVVAPEARHLGLATRLADHVREAAREAGAAAILSEAAPSVAAMLRARVRRCLGDAPPDPRFPGLSFTWFVTDLR
jgi:GNAT superfamily N-acetyltransferase